MEKFFPNDFEYYQINIIDRETQDLSLYFEESNNFIKNAKNVLVHCVAGKSRSPSIVIAEKKMSFNEAFSLVKLKRSIIDPNANFIKNLQYLEEKYQNL